MVAAHFIHWIRDDPPDVERIQIVAVEEGDYVILCRRTAGEEPDYDFRFHLVGENGTYFTARSNVRSIWQGGEALSDEAINAINNIVVNRNNVRIYNPSAIRTRAETIGFFMALIAVSETAVVANLEALVGLLPNLSPFPLYNAVGNLQADLPVEPLEGAAGQNDPAAAGGGPEENGDGQPAAGGGPPIDEAGNGPGEDTGPAAEPDAPGDVDMNLFDRDVTEGEVIVLIRDIDPGVKYLGFSPREVRRAFLSRVNNIHTLNRDLQLCLVSLAHIGNNITKFNTKRVNLTVTKRILNVISAMGIAKKAGTSNILTLPRIGIAFMAEYLIYRKFLTKDLQNQTSAPISVVYQDLAFYGCENVRSMTGYAAYHIEFSGLIAQGGKGKDYTKEENRKEYERWNKIAANGYRSDTDIHENMAAAISAAGLSNAQASEMIRANIEGYKAFFDANPP